MDRSGGYLVADGNAKVQVGDVHNYWTAEESERNVDRKSLDTFRLTDPRDDKFRIEELKGGFLDESYRWVLETPEFIRWRHDEETRLLWIRGNSGKGKAMLLCGIINESEPLSKLRDREYGYLLSYFFCQATHSGLNNTTSVLRGLIYLLTLQQPSLLSFLRDESPDLNHWNTRAALTRIFSTLLRDSGLQQSYLVIDALDECSEDLEFLLDFITADTTPQVKRLVSSRNRPDILEYLEPEVRQIPLSLELNKESVSGAVTIYIEYKIEQLCKRKKCTAAVRSSIYDFLCSQAGGTFLWVALVCHELGKTRPRKLLESLDRYSTGLDALYGRMMNEIEDPDCKRLLATMLTVYRPLSLAELCSFLGARLRRTQSHIKHC